MKDIVQNIEVDLLLEYSPENVFIHDNNGKLIYLNEKLLNLLNYKHFSKIKNNNFFRIVKLSEETIIHGSLKTFFSRIYSKKVHFEFSFITSKKQLIPVKSYGFPIKSKNTILYINISRDMSSERALSNQIKELKDQLSDLKLKIPEIRLWTLSKEKSSLDLIKKGGAALRESEIKYKEILENIKEGYFELNQNGDLIFYNNAFLDIMGYNSGEVMGMNYKKFFSGDIEPILKQLDNKLNINQTFEFEVMKKNRQKIIIESSFLEKFNSNGEIIGYYGMFRDITIRKKAQLLENKFKETLENKVKERTRNLNKALEQQKLFMNEILKSSQFKSQFMSKMSHELRTPLNSIIGFTDLLLEQVYGTLNKKQYVFLSDIKKSSEYLLELINHLLDMSKIEAGKLKLNFKKIELQEVLDQVISQVQPLIKDKQLSFMIEKRIDTNVMIRIDILRFKEILYNLLNNAITFTIKGGIILKVDRNNKYFRFDVIDTGIGIKKEDYGSVFQEFKRINEIKIGGTGLGLPLTKKLINLHGGKIWFTSEHGKGSTFSFLIPI